MHRRRFLHRALACGGLTLLPASAFWPRFARATDVPGEVPAVHGDGRRFGLPGNAVTELADALTGPLLLPRDAEYATARRVWNGMIDRQPALIARCAGAADIRAAVQFAASHDLLVSVRGGGHSISGKAVCDGGLMIDLSGMRAIAVDADGQRALAQPGILLGELDRATVPQGLVTTAGTVSHTGAAGLTLGGGFGRTCRKFGLTCDNLVAAEVITASGAVLQVSEAENPALLWGLRGGGGNFGVVSRFEYALHPMQPKVLGGTLSFAFEEAGTVLRNYAEFCAGAPDELNTDWTIIAPRGRRAMVSIEACHIGAQASGEKLFGELQGFGRPLASRLGAVDYLKLQRRIDASVPHGGRYYMKSGFVREIHQAFIDDLLGAYRLTPDLTLVVTLQQLGGAVGRVAQDGTAFSHRDAAWSLLVMAGWREPSRDAEFIAEVRRFWSHLEPHSSGFYVNSVTPVDEPKVQATYRGNYARLAALKRRYDPGNLFRLNANVKPAGA